MEVLLLWIGYSSAPQTWDGRENNWNSLERASCPPRGAPTPPPPSDTLHATYPQGLEIVAEGVDPKIEPDDSASSTSWRGLFLERSLEAISGDVYF